MDKKRAEIFNERTVVNREVKTLETQINGAKLPAADAPNEFKSVSSLMSELKTAQELKAAHDEKLKKLDQMRTMAKTMREELQKFIDDGKALAEEINSADFHDDVPELLSEIDNIESLNAKASYAIEYSNRKKRLKEKQDEAAELTQQISDIDAEKEKAFKEADMPIDGLSFDADGILFQDIPFAQCSSAEQMKVCVAIAAALNPKIRVIRIQDASLLDAESMKIVERLAQEKDIQIWMERVSDGEKGIGVVIEDGEVKEGD